jgi:hypothetical protein
MTIAEAVKQLLDVIVAEHSEVKLDLIAPWNLYVVEECGETSIKIVVHGLRLKK